jgi:hypothetical protein
MTLALTLLAVGLLFTSLAVVGWRHRTEERISLIEAGILKATGQEPLPLTRFDKWFQRFQLLMMSIFGPAITVLGLLFLLVEMGVL